MTTTREALEVAVKALEISTDWNGPTDFDIEAPAGWESALSEEEEGWLNIYGIIKKCKEALAAEREPSPEIDVPPPCACGGAEYDPHEAGGCVWLACRKCGNAYIQSEGE